VRVPGRRLAASGRRGEGDRPVVPPAPGAPGLPARLVTDGSAAWPGTWARILPQSAEHEHGIAGEPVLDHVVVADHVRQRGIGVGPRGNQGGLHPRIARRQ